MNALQAGGQRFFFLRVSQFWTSHSGRKDLPSATAALQFSEQDLDILGGWSANARLAKRRITSLQKAVSLSFQSKKIADPLTQEETIQDFDRFMVKAALEDSERARCINLLTIRAYENVPRDKLLEVEAVADEPMGQSISVVDDSRTILAKSDKRRNRENACAATLVENSTEVQARIQSELEDGFYLP